MTETAKSELPQALAATEYYSDDGTFARMVVSVAAEKSILTDELINGTKEYLRKLASQGGTPSVREIDLGMASTELRG